jgi:phosphoglycerate dehydrogenase-like enzyme
VARLAGIYALDEQAFDDVYGPQERAAIAEVVDIVAPAQTAESIRAHPDALAAVDLIFSGWGAPVMGEDFLTSAPRLTVVFYAAGSVRGFVTEALWARGIRVTSAASANAIPVAEYTLAAILFSLKQGWPLALRMKHERRSPPLPHVAGAYGSVVGLISLGMIGRVVRERLRPFDLRVLAYDPYATPEQARALDLELAPLEEVFRVADVVSLHAPLLAETVGMIRGDHLAAMKRGATFINTARGALVREEEMIAVLARRPDLLAVLDVTDPEPPILESPLYALPNVVLTPHIAGALGGECRRLGRMMVEELARYLRGAPLHGEVRQEQAALRA